MGQKSSKINGTVAPGFETVREMFEDNFKKGREENAQLCVYVGEEKVVDLWGSVENNSYTADTLSNIFSSTKSLTAIAMASLVEKGLMRYQANIAEYWPEFGNNGKEDVTVADLMRHEAGLANFDVSIDPQDTLTSNVKENKIGKVIEEQKLKFPEGSKREYHSLTRGWVANEIYRRVHPDGETIGEYIKNEAREPLNADVFVGVSKAAMANYVPVREMSMVFVFCQSIIPDMFGGGVDINFWGFLQMLNLLKNYPIPEPPNFVGFDMNKKPGEFFNLDGVRKGETSSGNGNCSARGLAKLAAAMANKGTFQGVAILGKTGWDALHADPTPGSFFGIPSTSFTQGGINKFEEAEKSDGAGRDGFYGWLGYGGSVFQWHPQHRIGFAYVPTLLEWYCIENNKGRKLQGEVVKCLQKLNKKK